MNSHGLMEKLLKLEKSTSAPMPLPCLLNSVEHSSLLSTIINRESSTHHTLRSTLNLMVPMLLHTVQSHQLKLPSSQALSHHPNSHGQFLLTSDPLTLSSTLIKWDRSISPSLIMTLPATIMPLLPTYKLLIFKPRP